MPLRKRLLQNNFTANRQRSRDSSRRKSLRYKPPPLISWWQYVLGAIVVCFAAYYVYANFDRHKPPPKRKNKLQIFGVSRESKRKKTQRESNRETRKNWKLFASHRKRVFEIIDSNHEENEKSILILGSGNCNDLDGRKLFSRFPNMTFVDIDIEATTAGVSRMIRPVPDWFSFHSSDLTGAYHLLDTPNWNSVIEVVDTYRWFPQTSLHDVVYSANVLSPIITETFLDAYDRFTDDEKYDEESEKMIFETLRQQHLETMLLNMKPGGWGIVILKMVHKNTAPQITMRAVSRKMMHSLVSKNNFFAGMNPFEILEEWENDSRLANVKVEDPWLYMKEYLVYAITFQKSSVSKRFAT